MRLVRGDSWRTEDDEILATIVLEHIRNNSTQLVAFDAVSDRLGRTAAACGFRWNSEVRKRYKKEISEAKQLRNATRPFKTYKSRITDKVAITSNANHLDTIMEQISNYKHTFQAMENQIREQQLALEQKDRTIEELERKLEEATTPKERLTDDYKSLLQILGRARELGALDRTS